ncbi:uncharacterized protein KY384_006465 [Bacidia gigantensis]|uniref:uncharacterized protein n=1 Tax=Bacidia gigantensis TaxID=2732470 RepID=UPI001D04A967|nr:uncharacterized protein KY384_006465 [Bacidia gigantensis]KAG8528777.1 hypothetical protein KY384_006465 [Bacidia gigantensis]
MSASEPRSGAVAEIEPAQSKADTEINGTHHRTNAQPERYESPKPTAEARARWAMLASLVSREEEPDQREPAPSSAQERESIIKRAWSERSESEIEHNQRTGHIKMPNHEDYLNSDEENLPLLSTSTTEAAKRNKDSRLSDIFHSVSDHQKLENKQDREYEERTLKILEEADRALQGDDLSLSHHRRRSLSSQNDSSQRHESASVEEHHWLSEKAEKQSAGASKNDARIPSSIARLDRDMNQASGTIHQGIRALAGEVTSDHAGERLDHVEQEAKQAFIRGKEDIENVTKLAQASSNINQEEETLINTLESDVKRFGQGFQAAERAVEEDLDQSLRKVEGSLGEVAGQKTHHGLKEAETAVKMGAAMVGGRAKAIAGSVEEAVSLKGNTSRDSFRGGENTVDRIIKDIGHTNVVQKAEASTKSLENHVGEAEQSIAMRIQRQVGGFKLKADFKMAEEAVEGIDGAAKKASLKVENGVARSDLATESKANKDAEPLRQTHTPFSSHPQSGHLGSVNGRPAISGMQRQAPNSLPSTEGKQQPQHHQQESQIPAGTARHNVPHQGGMVHQARKQPQPASRTPQMAQKNAKAAPPQLMQPKANVTRPPSQHQGNMDHSQQKQPHLVGVPHSSQQQRKLAQPQQMRPPVIGGPSNTQHQNHVAQLSPQKAPSNSHSDQRVNPARPANQSYPEQNNIHRPNGLNAGQGLIGKDSGLNHKPVVNAPLRQHQPEHRLFRPSLDHERVLKQSDSHVPLVQSAAVIYPTHQQITKGRELEQLKASHGKPPPTVNESRIDGGFVSETGTRAQESKSRQQATVGAQAFRRKQSDPQAALNPISCPGQDAQQTSELHLPHAEKCNGPLRQVQPFENMKQQLATQSEGSIDRSNSETESSNMTEELMNDVETNGEPASGHSANPKTQLEGYLEAMKQQTQAYVGTSDGSPGFLEQMLQLLFRMAEDSLPEIQRRLDQNGQHCGPGQPLPDHP